MAMKGDTANDDDPAATISTLNSFIKVEREFCVVAAESNDGGDNFDCGMAIGNCKRRTKSEPSSGTNRLVYKGLYVRAQDQRRQA